MESSAYRLTVARLLGLVACVALNFWLFRQGALWGILGLNVSKHMLIAYLCHAAGVNRQPEPSRVSVGPEPAATLRGDTLNGTI